MEKLPLEAKQEILLHVPLSSLREVCASSSQFRDLCLSKAFWIRRFENSSLPPPSKIERSIPKWIAYYTRAIQARDEADKIFRELLQGNPRVYSIGLHGIRNPKMLLVPGLPLKVVKEFLAMKRESEKKQDEIERLLDLGGDLLPEEEEHLNELIVSSFADAEISTSGEETTYSLRARLGDSFLNEDISYPTKEFPGLWDLLYRLLLNDLLY